MKKFFSLSVFLGGKNSKFFLLILVIVAIVNRVFDRGFFFSGKSCLVNPYAIFSHQSLTRSRINRIRNDGQLCRKYQRLWNRRKGDKTVFFFSPNDRVIRDDFRTIYTYGPSKKVDISTRTRHTITSELQLLYLQYNCKQEKKKVCSSDQSHTFAHDKEMKVKRREIRSGVIIFAFFSSFFCKIC